MPPFRPFRALRYDRACDPALVTAPPYDVVDEELRAELLQHHPENIVRVDLPAGEEGRDPYEVAPALLHRWQATSLLVRDPEPAFYPYAMDFTDDSGQPRQTIGVFGALTLEAPGTGGILPHEHTTPKARSDRLRMLQVCRANLSAVWGLVPAEGLSDLLVTEEAALADFTDEDGVRHRLWRTSARDQVSAIAAAVGSSPVVIADGHHRFETGGNYRRERAEAGIDDPGADAIMALVVELAPEELCVRAIHRLLHGVGDLDLRTVAEPMFDVVALGANTADGVAGLEAAMRDEGGLGLVDSRGLALLVPRPALDDAMRHEPVELRDVDAARFDAGLRPTIERAGVTLTYRNDAATCAAHVEKGVADASVLLRPVSVETIRAAAEARIRMPEKTTFFAPKPRTGMVFRDLDHP